MTEPCTLKIGQNLYKCIDDVLTEVDSNGWELMQLGGDGNTEGGWKYVFRKKPQIMRSFKTSTPHNKYLNQKTKSHLKRFIGRPFLRKRSGSL
jgi:hypothetical protein